MMTYNKKLKSIARDLRSNQTDAEMLLWSRIRRKQLCNIQFYRQKPVSNYVVDFYAPSKNIVIEVDGGQHFEEAHIKRDKKRDKELNTLGIKVLRFDNLQVLNATDAVLESIFREIYHF